MIKEIKNEADFTTSVRVIQNAFATVAAEFHLTPDNCPTHPSFMTEEKLKSYTEKGARLFGLFLEGEQAGFVAVEKADDELYYLEKLAVLPEYRHRGFGKRLMDFVFQHVREAEGKKIGIAIIDGHEVLKQWYFDYGFRETEKREFPQLPFVVCFMEKAVSG